MSMFDFFKKKQRQENGHSTLLNELTQKPVDTTPDVAGEKPPPANTPPEIPEHIFVEHLSPPKRTPMETANTAPAPHDIHLLYSYLEQNLEKKGYEDALMNPDTSYMDEHIRFLQNELNITISKVNAYYKNYLRQIDFHIETRKRHDMIEMVDELLTKRATVEDEMKTVAAIEQDARNGNGITQNVVLTYKKGFKNGFAAITYGTILNKQN